MYQYTRYLLAFGLVVTSAALANPCHAQTVDSTNDITNDASMMQSILESYNSSENKSELPSDAISQATPQTTTVTNPNPRIPIPSRIFPSMQQ